MAIEVGALALPVVPDLQGFVPRLRAGMAAGGLKGVGMAAGAVVGAGLAAGVAGAIGAFKLGETFDKAFDTIRVGSGATGKALEGLKGDFRATFGAIPTDTGKAATAIADFNTRLGLTGKPLQEVSKRAIEVARITGDDLSRVIQTSSRVFGDWGIEAGKMPGHLDKLFRASQSTGIPVSRLSEQLVKFGAPLRQLGFDFDTSAGLLGKFEKEGVNAELVMGSLRIALGKMARDGEPAQETLQRVVGEIESAGSASEANALALELFGARAGPDMAAAIREGRFELGDLLGTIKEGDETILGAAKATNDWRESWKVIVNNGMLLFEPVATRVFGAVSDFMALVVERGIPALRKIGDAFKNLSGPGGIGAFGKALDQVFGGQGRFEGFFTAVGRGVELVGDAISTLRGHFDRGAQAAGPKGPLGRAFEGIARFVRQVWPQISGIITGALDVVRAVIKAATDYIVGVWRRNGDNLMNHARNIWRALQQIIKGALDVIRGIINVVLGALTGDWRKAWQGIRQILGGLWNVMQGLVRTAISTVRAVIGQVMASIQTLWSGAWTRLRNTLSSAWEAIKTATRNAVSNMLDRIRGFASDALATVFRWGATLRSNFTQIMSSIRDTVRDRINAVVNFFRELPGRIADAVRNLASTIKKKVQDVLSGIKATLNIGAIFSGDGLGVAGSGSTSGLTPRLKAAAAMVKRMGGSISSGFRPGAITATGNRSYHGMGRAIDIVPPNMALFNRVRSAFPNATELIYSPAGARQLWHGRSHVYSGVTRANHFDHIHLALNRGGRVPGRGPDRDSRLAAVTPGEFMVNRGETGKWLPLLEAINSGRLTSAFAGMFNKGGLVGAARQVLKRLRGGGAIFEDLTWRGASKLVGRHNDALVRLLRPFLPKGFDFRNNARTRRVLIAGLERVIARQVGRQREDRVTTKTAKVAPKAPVADIAKATARATASAPAASEARTSGGGGELLAAGRYKMILRVGSQDMDAYLEVREDRQARATRQKTKAKW